MDWFEEQKQQMHKRHRENVKEMSRGFWKGAVGILIVYALLLVFMFYMVYSLFTAPPVAERLGKVQYKIDRWLDK